MDYPIYDSVPFGLTFTCGGKLPGYYADPEARCQVSLPYWRLHGHYTTPRYIFIYFEYFRQVWHWCLPNGRMFSFLCPNGTVFSQSARVCDWWFKVFHFFNVYFNHFDISRIKDLPFVVGWLQRFAKTVRYQRWPVQRREREQDLIIVNICEYLNACRQKVFPSLKTRQYFNGSKMRATSCEFLACRRRKAERCNIVRR